MAETKVRIRVVDAEIEVNGRVGRVSSLSVEASFDRDAPAVLGDVVEFLSTDRAEIKHLREQVTSLQARGTELVEENRTLKASLAEASPIAKRFRK